MHRRYGRWPVAVGLVSAISMTLGLMSAGCMGPGAFEPFGTPFGPAGGATQTIEPGSTGRFTGTSGSGDRSIGDPCQEEQTRKFVRISMRNLARDYIHYFLVFVAYVDDGTGLAGDVCADDVALYTAFGYELIPSGTSRAFGNYCFEGPVLLYYHRNGQFRDAQGLASAIAPAQGSTATYDEFFGANGASVPVPSQILFHNPGTSAEGRALKVADSRDFPCDPTINDSSDPICEQDSWYYVDQRDIRAGSTVIGRGSYVRVPADIEGTGCDCGIGNQAYQVLAPTGANASSALCSEFLRGGRIEYVFIRDDQEPPFPQLLWRVSDSTGSRAHDFDPRGKVP